MRDLEKKNQSRMDAKILNLQNFRSDRSRALQTVYHERARRAVLNAMDLLEPYESISGVSEALLYLDALILELGEEFEDEED